LFSQGSPYASTGWWLLRHPRVAPDLSLVPGAAEEGSVKNT
jgi:hypothetical protein